jgi:nitrate/TMAO reductase-like tetraheme cytochrome c subunit
MSYRHYCFLIAFLVTYVGCDDEPVEIQKRDYMPPGGGTAVPAGEIAGQMGGTEAGVMGGILAGEDAGSPAGMPVEEDPCLNYQTQFSGLDVGETCDNIEGARREEALENGWCVDCSVLTDEVRCADGEGIDNYTFLMSACAECYSENGKPNWVNLRCAEVCDDGQDNDVDGYTDCEDVSDCCGQGSCDPCPGEGEGGVMIDPVEPPESCMQCHNGAATQNDYSGPGITNPHPFGGRVGAAIKCTTCHGGNGSALGKANSHIPPHPKVGDKQYQANNAEAANHRITLAGIDKLQPSEYPGEACDGGTCSNLDYLQFINPGDLRVVAAGRGCGAGGCHAGEHAEWVPRSVIATTNGFFSGTRFMVGLENRIPEYRASNNRQFADEGDALSGAAPRALTNPAYNANNREIGEVGSLVEQAEYAQFNGIMFNNPGFDANQLPNDIDNTDPQRPNRIRTGSNLEKLVDEQVSITCGNCHLYSAGANNRYADFRSSGCTACHMQYSMDGRSRSTDPNVNKLEPANPDQIANGERAHISDHIIRNVSKVSNGVIVRGITDKACVGCHQGSNRTVLQYWGIRLDQNADLANNTQYPENPVTFTNTANDRRLFDPAVDNNTFNGRNADQYILTEDYDNDGLDDTPPDVHYESGMGCIDCHGSRDMHGGTKNDVTSGKIMSRQDQATSVTCESCHGDIDFYVLTVPCEDY